MEIPKTSIIGNDLQAGTYVLRIRLSKSAEINFGGFKKGKLISLPAGDYTYVGSALSEKGSTSLARRLVRHATRSNDKPPHRICPVMITQFQECGLGPSDPIPKNGKKLFWNVDYMLDLEIAEIINVLAIRSSQKLESTIGRFLELNKDSQIIENGLGANDAPNHTYILRVNSDDMWWSSITKDIQIKYLHNN